MALSLISLKSLIWAGSGVTFLTPRSYEQVLLLLPLLGFFNNGIFSGFPRSSSFPSGADVMAAGPAWTWRGAY